MAVTQVTAVAQQWRGDDDSTGVERRTVVYQVLVDSADDGPEIVLTASGLPAVNDQYLVANDSNSALILKNRSASRGQGRLQWFVTCNYDNSKDDQNKDDQGNPTTDPAKIRKIVLPGFGTRRKIYRKAIFRGFVDADGNPLVGRPDFIVNRWRSITNSALTPVVPAVEGDETFLILRITNVVFVWDAAWNSIQGSINDDLLLITSIIDGGQINWGAFPPYTMLCNSLNCEEMQLGDNTYFRVTAELWHNRDTWRHDELDRGRQADVMARAGDFGYGSVSSADIAIDAPAAVNLMDHHGNQITDPVPLDGFGHVNKDREFYLRWSLKPEKPFTPYVGTLF